MKRDTKQSILDAAEKVFSVHGYLGATTLRIAQVAKVNEVTLFRHFKNKETLFKEVISRFAEKQSYALEIADEDNAEFRDILSSFAHSYLRTVGRSPDLIRSVLSEVRRHPGEVKCIVAEVVEPVRKQFLKLIRKRQKAGEIHRKVDCEIALDIFRGALFARIVAPHVMGRNYSDKEYVENCVDMFVRSVEP